MDTTRAEHGTEKILYDETGGWGLCIESDGAGISYNNKHRQGAIIIWLMTKSNGTAMTVLLRTPIQHTILGRAFGWWFSSFLPSWRVGEHQTWLTPGYTILQMGLYSKMITHKQKIKAVKNKIILKTLLFCAVLMVVIWMVRIYF